MGQIVGELYDLIFIGIDTEAADRKASIDSIAELLGLEASEVEHIADKNLRAIVKQGIFLDDAKNFQQQLLRRGGFCNYRPSPKSQTQFELAPIESDDEELMFVCPACAYKEKVATPAELPATCPRCGIIPNKFNKVAAEKHERELVKRRLLNKHKLQEKLAQDEAQRKEQEARRRQLEDEIRKELGLPRVINSRLRLLSSGAVLLLLGLGAGAGAVGLYYNLLELPGDWGLSAGTGGNQAKLQLSPEQETLLQLSNFSKDMDNKSLDGVPQIGLGGTNPLQTVQLSNEESTAITVSRANTQQKPNQLNGTELLQDSLIDREWDLFLSSEAARLAKLKQTDAAFKMALAIQNTQLKISTFAQLAEYYLDTKNKPEADKLFDIAIAYIDSLPDKLERAESLGWWASLLFRMGEKAKAKQYLETTLKLVSSLPDGEEKIRGLASLAASQMQVGQKKQAAANFQQANQILPSINDPTKKLRTYVYLASRYAQIGDKSIATSILTKALNSLKLIKDKSAQQNLVGEIAIALVRMGEADYALASLSKLSAPSKETLLFNVTRELAYTDQPYEALKSLDQLTAPDNQARAAALLSLTTRNHASLKLISANLQAQAIAAQAKIDNPVNQALARAEMSRYFAHTGYAKEADDWARKATTSANGIRSKQERDAVLAVLSNNFAFAKLPALASECADQMDDKELAAVTAKQIGKINETLSGQ